MHIPGLRDACVEAGIGDILIYAGGQLTIRRPEWEQVRTRFVDELGLDRIYPPNVSPNEPIRDLESDISTRRAGKSGASKPAKGAA